ncbi:alpha/beta fold hydrolase [Thalassobacillus hwangdonensis]|uniref:Alpha/beta fold hydrolase n=1 Tax=Thalassobacillus hwangdonensis TaxID=546108 RepID=A0ABW3L5C3_9BACI
MLEYILKDNHESADYVVFIHGLGGNSKVFYKQLAVFKRHFNILSIHLPGHGKSPKTTSYNEPFSIPVIAKEVIDVLDHLHIKRAHFVGISLGSMVIQNIMSRIPERFQSAVMGGAVPKMNLIAKTAMLFGDLTKNILPHHALYWMFAHIMMPRANHKAGREAFIKEAKQLDRDDFFSWFNLAREPEASYKYIHRAYKVPKLFISGTQDHLYVKYVRKQIKTLKNAKLVEIPNCGHVCNIEKASRFNELALDFVYDHIDIASKSKAL